jgi:hypothetical protein
VSEATVRAVLESAARHAIRACAMDPAVFVAMAREAIDWADLEASSEVDGGETRTTSAHVAHSKRTRT